MRGNLEKFRSFQRNPAQFLRDYASDHQFQSGSIDFALTRLHIVFDQEMIGQVLQSRSEEFPQSRQVFKKITPITGKKGLVQLQGKNSAIARTKAFKLFRKPSMEHIGGHIRGVSEELLQSIEEANGELILDPSQIDEIVLRVASKMFLGVDLKNLSGDVARDFYKLNRLCGERMLSPLSLPLFFPTVKNRKILKHRAKLRENFSRLMRSKRSEDQNTLLGVFSDDENVLDHVLTFLFAGHDTTSSSILFTLMLLSERKDLQERISGGDDLLLQCAYKESLRLFPPAYMLAREARDHCELGRLRIKRGDLVIIPLVALHRNPANFSEPDKFLPERFLAGQSSIDRFSYLPFGFSKKSCVGEKLANLESSIVIKEILKRFELVEVERLQEIDSLVTLQFPSQSYLKLKRKFSKKEVINANSKTKIIER